MLPTPDHKVPKALQASRVRLVRQVRREPAVTVVNRVLRVPLVPLAILVHKGLLGAKETRVVVERTGNAGERVHVVLAAGKARLVRPANKAPKVLRGLRELRDRKVRREFQDRQARATTARDSIALPVRQGSKSMYISATPKQQQRSSSAS